MKIIARLNVTKATVRESLMYNIVRHSQVTNGLKLLRVSHYFILFEDRVHI